MTDKKKKTPKKSNNKSKKIQFYDVCHDIDEWPQSWKGLDEDVPIGESLIPIFKEFIKTLIDKGLSKKTIQKHVDFLWSLGGQIITKVNMYEDYDGKKGKELLLKNIDDLGGPFWKHASSMEEQDQFDATCRRLYKFLMRGE